MSNRAVVTVKGSSVGVYLHWNGSPEHVCAFLEAAKDLGVRDPVADPAYFYARFTQIVANFFGGTTSVGVDGLSHLDTSDNGIYTIGAGFKVLGRADCELGVYDLGVYRRALERSQKLFERC